MSILKEISIRPVRAGDAFAIAAVHVASWRTTYRGILSDTFLDSISIEKRKTMWEQTIINIESGSKVQVMFVAENSAGKIVGFIVGCKEREGHSKCDGELAAIYLYKENQKQGLGRRLTLSLAKKLHALGYRSMMSWVLEKNPSRCFYESIGGQLLSGTKEVEFGTIKCIEVAYGWEDLSMLIENLTDDNTASPVKVDWNRK